MNKTPKLEKFWEEKSQEMRNRLTVESEQSESDEDRYYSIDLVGESLEELTPNSLSMTQHTWIQYMSGSMK